MFDRNNYPYFASFLSCSFFQDERISNELVDVVHEYASTAHPSSVLGTRADIQRFLYEHGNDPDTAFEKVFDPLIDPHGYGCTTKEWLQEIDRRLAEHPGRPAF